MLKVGDIVERDRPDLRTQTHYVESVVAGAAITRCGRRMEPLDKAGRPLSIIITATAATATAATCRRC